MFNSVQIKFHNNSSTNNISTTTTIKDQTAYLVTNMTSRMEDVLPLLLHIILFNLNVKCIPNNQICILTPLPHHYNPQVVASYPLQICHFHIQSHYGPLKS